MKRIIGLLICIALLAPRVCNAAEVDTQIVVPLDGATASSTYGNNLPSYAVDTNAQTFWNSGKPVTISRPPLNVTPWIQFDLGTSKSISKVRLRPSQNPSGNTKHLIYVGESPATLQLANTVTGYTTGGVAFDVPVMATGRYIRVETILSPSWVAWEQIDVFEAKGVKYYGYYLGGDYDAQTAEHSNLTHFYGNSSTVQAHLSSAAARNMRSVVDVSLVFFGLGGNKLQPNYQTEWTNLASAIGNQANNIAAFYVFDEPSLPAHNVSRSDLQVAINTIKASFPNIPTASIFNSDNVTDLVDMFDWVGVDAYDNGAGLNGILIPTRGTTSTVYSNFRSKLDLSRQRVILVPQAGMPESVGNDYGLNGEADQWLNLALKDPLVIAVMPFLWQDKPADPQAPAWWGVQHYPNTLAKFTSFGTTIDSRARSVYWPW